MRPPTMTLAIYVLVKALKPYSLPYIEMLTSEHLLQLLHWQATNCLGGGLRLEHAWLLGERVDALARLGGWLVLQLHVEHTCELEGAGALHLCHSHTHPRIHNTLHVFRLQACGLPM